ncbi:hypothetical protein BC938DRAFT_482608 [Jimgerdemannia flammicorona]|uniref:Uncharacterized protein n=1 Tax=Jimgerdemannia flammicorona TaxID=994334 RepID=A0A433QDL1_9FUNG|nr:hypothetical protein BC938DRAFT_482608 [Jimgerdemannia flammicorona]
MISDLFRINRHLHRLPGPLLWQPAQQDVPGNACLGHRLTRTEGIDASPEKYNIYALLVPSDLLFRRRRQLPLHQHHGVCHLASVSSERRITSPRSLSSHTRNSCEDPTQDWEGLKSDLLHSVTLDVSVA